MHAAEILPKGAIVYASQLGPMPLKERFSYILPHQKQYGNKSSEGNVIFGYKTTLLKNQEPNNCNFFRNLKLCANLIDQHVDMHQK